MNFGLLVVGLGLLSFPALAASRSSRLPPAEWARVAVLAIGLGALAIYTGLVMTAVLPVLHVLELEGLSVICDPVVHSLMIGGPLVGWTAAVLTGIVTAVGLHAAFRSRRAVRSATIEPWLGQHSDEGDYELVVVPTDALVAVGVPGLRPQVVISEGLMAELDATRLQAVIAHEVAHLSLRHRRFLVVVTIVERALGVLPFVRRSASAARESLEIWADDAAVRSTDATEQTLHSALVAVSTASDAVLHGERSSGPTRARRLSDPAPCFSAPARGLAYLPVGALMCGAATLLVGWVLSSHHMLALGRYC
jgi:Zn-dependent protease with chaperone function